MSFAQNEMHYQEYLYDFAEDGGATGEIVLSDKDNYPELPEDAMVYQPMVKVETSLDSVADGASLSVGTSTDPDGFLTATGEANLSAGTGLMGDGALVYDGGTADAPNDQLVYIPGSTAANQKVSVTISGEDLTAGKLRVIVPFFLPGRES